MVFGASETKLAGLELMVHVSLGIQQARDKSRRLKKRGKGNNIDAIFTEQYPLTARYIIL